MTLCFKADFMDCVRCGSGDYVKDGNVRQRQRYQCKYCNYRYTVKSKCHAKSPEIRQLAHNMYLEGLGFRAIGRLLNVSHTAVFGWLKKAGKDIELSVEDESIEVVEVDEMHSFVGQKETTAGFGLWSTD